MNTRSNGDVGGDISTAIWCHHRTKIVGCSVAPNGERLVPATYILVGLCHPLAHNEDEARRTSLSTYKDKVKHSVLYGLTPIALGRSLLVELRKTVGMVGVASELFETLAKTMRVAVANSKRMDRSALGENAVVLRAVTCSLA